MKTNNKNPKRKFNEEKFCEYHQVHGHDTGECKVVLAQAKRMRATWDSRSSNVPRKTFSNKTWTKNDKKEENPNNNKNNNAYLQEAISKAVKEALMTERQNDLKEMDQLNVDDFANLQLESDSE